MLLFSRFFLLGQTFLNCDCASNRFLRTRKGTQRVPFVLLVLFAYANNPTLLCATRYYFVKPSCTATAQATQFIEPKKHLCRCFWVLVLLCLRKDFSFACASDYLVRPSCTATAQATEAPTIGLLPIPIRPIISTCAGTDEEPANCASECILPIVSVIP